MQAKRAPVSTLEMLAKASAAFKPRTIRPDTSTNQIMYDAGAAAVLKWIESYVDNKAHETQVGAVQRHELPDSTEAALRAAFGGKSEI